MNKSVLIETPRLILRTPQAGDAKPLNDAINRSLPELQRWQPWAFDPSLETTTKFINDSIKLKNKRVVIIHGIGQGIVKDEVYKCLRRNKNVINFKLNVPNIGSTTVDLKID